MFTKNDYRFMDQVMRHAIGVAPVGGAKCSAILTIGNRVVSYGYNQYKTHPLQAKYSRNKQAINLHAEIDAIRNALRMKSFHIDDFKKTTLYIGRVKHETYSTYSPYVWGMARPCRRGCEMAIAAFNIGRIVYSQDNQNFEVL